MHTVLQIRTSGRGTTDVTSRLSDIVQSAEEREGLLHLFIQHTSASLIICENADDDVRRDLERFTAAWCPDGNAIFSHTAEGPDDMPAHIRSIFTQTSLSIPFIDGALMLGTWQGVYLWEHRTHAHKRTIVCSIVGR